MDNLTNKKVKIIAFILTIVNFTCAYCGIMYVGSHLIFLSTAIILQCLIVLFYFIIYLFKASLILNSQELANIQENIILKSNLLEQKMNDDLRYFSTELNVHNQQSLERVSLFLEEKHIHLTNLFVSLSTENSIEAQNRKNNILMLDEKINQLSQIVNSANAKEVYNATVINASIEDLKQNINGLQIQEENSLNRIEIIVGDVIQNIQEVKLLEVNSFDVSKRLLESLLKYMGEINTYQVDSSNNIRMLLRELFGSVEVLKSQDIELSNEIKYAINEMKNQGLGSNQELKKSLEEIKLQDIDLSTEIKSSINELKTQELGSVTELKKSLEEIKLQDIDLSTQIKSSINELKTQEFDSFNQLTDSIEVFSSQGVVSLEATKMSIQKLHEFIDEMIKQDINSGENLSQLISSLFEKMQYLNAEELEAITKLKDYLTSVNEIANAQSVKIASIATNINDIIIQTEKSITSKDVDTLLIINNLNDFQIDFQNKTEEIKTNINTVVEKIEENKKEGDFSSTKLLDLISKKVGWLDRNTKSELSYIYDRIDSLFSIHHMIDIKSPLPIMNDWAITSDYGLDLMKMAIAKGKGSIIDVGSGVSTLIFGYVLQKRGAGKVIALEHDKTFYNATKKMIKEHQLEDFVDLYYCPLIEYVINKNKWLWYDFSKVKFPADVSIVNIDGPPGATQPLARYPAVPLLIEYVGTNTTILLDDGAREDETEIAAQWTADFNLKSQFYKSHKGHFVFQKK